MEVFKILGRIAVSNEDANEKIEETSDKAEKTSKKMSSVFGNIGKFMLKAAKVAVVATTAVATGIAGITAKAVSEYADYEQLVGGVETLFKDSSDKVVEYANNAYKTAGLSANEYMDTVTSFSASLLQGLEGDTAQAAEIANTAIVDMADNANKMGTDMASIQNAYQGFAKQNYTMLDNLKLGYGGTASEMARLINDSGVLGDTMTVTADNVNSVSFDKMIEAIHTVQVEMGISGLTAEQAAEAVKNGTMTQEEALAAMGTTAKEAATTIQGSIGMMKSAWANLLIGMADPSQDMGVLMNNLVDSAMAVADNLVPRIADTLPRVVTGLSQLAQKLAPYIPPLIEQLLPSLIQGATSLLSEVVNNLPGILETLLPGIGGELGQSISTALNSVFSTLTSILPPMMQIIQAVLPPLTNLINMLLPPVTQIIQSLLPVLMAILQPILELLQPFLDMLTPIIDLVMQVITPLTDLINMILPPLAEILSMLMEDYLNVLKPILEWYCKMLSGTLKSAIKLIVTVINNCKESFAAAWRGIKKAWNAAPEFFSNIGSNIKGAFAYVGTWFSDIFSKAYNGVKNKFSPIVNFFSETWQKIKNIFGKVGTAIADGLSGAVTSAVNAILSKATGIINGFIRAINSAISVLNKIPKVSISRIDELDAPQLAEGGVLKRGQVGILEGNGAEAVVPLEKNTGWIRKVAEDMADITGGTPVGGNSECLNVLYKILEIIKHIDDNLYDLIVKALTDGVRLKIDGREFGRMVKANA